MRKINKITGYINGQRFDSKLEFDKIIDNISKQVNPNDLSGIEVNITHFRIKPSSKTWYKHTSLKSQRLLYAEQDLKFGTITQEDFNRIKKEEMKKLEYDYHKFKKRM